MGVVTWLKDTHLGRNVAIKSYQTQRINTIAHDFT